MAVSSYVASSKLKLKDNSIVSTEKFSEWVAMTSPDDQLLSTLIPDLQKMSTENNMDQPTYVSVYERGDDIYINYFLFYSLNPEPLCLLGCKCCCGFHLADIEHIQVHLKNRELERVYYSKHSGGNWVDKKDLLLEDGKPVVYVALNTHACYERPGLHLRIAGLVPDFTGLGHTLVSDKVIMIENELMYHGTYGNGRVAGFPQKSCWMREDITEDWRC